MAKPDRLYRSRTNRIIAGVAGGLGEYFDIDPTLVRVIFILLSVFHGGGVIIYLILWLIVPEEGSSVHPREHVKQSIHELRDRMGSLSKVEGSWIGWVILILGVLFLLGNFGYDLVLWKLWPLILILIGVSLLF